MESPTGGPICFLTNAYDFSNAEFTLNLFLCFREIFYYLCSSYLLSMRIVTACSLTPLFP